MKRTIPFFLLVILTFSCGGSKELNNENGNGTNGGGCVNTPGVFGILSEGTCGLNLDQDSAVGDYSHNGGQITLSSSNDNCEGSMSQAATATVAAHNQDAGWFVQWGTFSKANGVKDMSAYANGGLAFCVKTPVDLVVGIRSNDVIAGEEGSKILLSQVVDIDNQWHNDVIIPMACFTGPEPDMASLDRIKVFFNAASCQETGGTAGTSRTFLFDNIRWLKNIDPGLEGICDAHYGIFSETYPGLQLDVDGKLGAYWGGGGSISMDEDQSDRCEGAESIKATLDVGATREWAGLFFQWGMFDTTTTRDMSSYANGSLDFCIKTPVDLEIGIRSQNVPAGYERSKVLLSDLGITPDGDTWQDVSISIADHFSGPSPKADLSRMKVFFNLASSQSTGGTGGEVTVGVDHIRWSK